MEKVTHIPKPKTQVKTMEIAGIRVELWRGSVRFKGLEGTDPIMSVDTLKTIALWVDTVK